MKGIRVKFFVVTLMVAMAGFEQAKCQTQSDVNVSEGGYGLVKTNMNLTFDHGWGALEDCFSASVSYEFLKKKHFTISANGRYSSTEMKFGDNDLSLSTGENMMILPERAGLKGTHIMAQIGLTATFRTRLFGCPFMGVAMVTSEWGAGGFGRIGGIAMGMLMLRSNANTQFGIGPLVMINSSSKLPAFMVFMYRHTFNDKWKIQLYGGIFDVEYSPTRNDLIAVGADVNVKAFYFRPIEPTLPAKCRFTSTSFRPMIKYRKKLMMNMHLELVGGVALKMSSRVNGVTGSKELIDCRQKTAPFLQLGVSYGL